MKPVVLATILLSGCSSGILTTSNQGFDQTRLAPCSGADSPFETLAFADWPQKYHQTVAQTIEAHLTSLQDTNPQQLECTAADYSARGASGNVADTPFPAGSEVPVKVFFDASAIKASGYRLYLFYP